MLNEKKTVKFQSHAHVRTPRSAPEHVGHFFVTMVLELKSPRVHWECVWGNPDGKADLYRPASPLDFT
ncbi:hypothetical protein OUZ56_000075 [Daphnia magna]|uniref:Uncharacterized protein n=1 Tax=Daphnia magna TaxID=35525 RepID=A0ABQ9ZYN0_9CRUS|nr:hypothetical protein OUZ56_000075 [Daphnia magna]